MVKLQSNGCRCPAGRQLSMPFVIIIMRTMYILPSLLQVDRLNDIIQGGHMSLYRPGSSLETNWIVVPNLARSALGSLLEAGYHPVPAQQQVIGMALVMQSSNMPVCTGCAVHWA